jgi:hypothetical protein
MMRERSHGLDETGTVSTTTLTDDGSEAEEAARLSRQEIRQEEIMAALAVQDEVLQVHMV